MKLSQRTKATLKLGLKLAVSALGLWVVTQKIDFDDAREILANAKIPWLLASLLTFNLSQWVSTFRLNALLHAEGVPIGFWDNLRLYYQGMFYNLFLPGGIGGDGYKVFILNNHFRAPVKRLVRALIFDRGAGFVFLITLALGLVIFSSSITNYSWLSWASPLGISLVLVSFFLLIRWFFPVYRKAFWKISWRAAVVQVLQVLGALFLFLALGVEENLVDYLVLFQISSIAIVVPITIGGVGARELVFFYGPQFLEVDGNLGVIFSILFFLVIALSSLVGMFVQYDPRSESFSDSDPGDAGHTDKNDIKSNTGQILPE